MNDLKSCLSRAIKTLEPYVEELNAMNIFPIPDKDTGRNLYKTLEGIYSNTDQELGVKLLIAARGTSGNILSVFFKSWPLELSDNNVQKLRAALELSDTRLQKTLDRIQHGTIYDAMTCWPRDQVKDILEFFRVWIQNIEEGILKGPEIFPMLDEYGTLDSGAVGFYYIINGIAAELGLQYPMKHFYVERAHLPWRQENSRYCIEALITDMVDQSYISEAIWKLGDSLIIITDSTNPKFFKLHIHCNKPDHVKQMCQHAGTIIDWKVDDMKKASEN